MTQENLLGENTRSNEEPVESDEIQDLSESYVFGDISSRLIRQWIVEGKAEYERQQREQQNKQGEETSEETA